MGNMIETLRRFAEEEDGANLAEYLVLMGVITVAVVGGIAFFGAQLAAAFSSWGSWIQDNTGSPT
jgi:pilus assembly protein Flp/PilA